MNVASLIVSASQIYLGLGALVALLFVLLGVSRVDAGAKGSWPLFRVLILPGATLLWPFVLWRWIAALRAPAPAPKEHA